MLTTALIAAIVSSIHTIHADTTNCLQAARFLRDDRHMVATIDADTIDDWRTGRKTAGCLITAAGGSPQTIQKAALEFYERVRAAGWIRTPDPRDAPTEASLRFRRENSDCLFNVNGSALLNTDAEQRVNDALKLSPGDVRYQVYVMCVPAAAAKPM